MTKFEIETCVSDMPRSPAGARRHVLGRTLAVAALSLIAPSVGSFAVASSLSPRCPVAAAPGELVYIGSQTTEPGQGIFGARLDPVTGRLTPIGVTAQALRPTWLTAHPTLPVIYAVSETGNDGKTQGKVLTFRADPTSGLLSNVGVAESGGGGPTNLAADISSKTVLVANFGTGQVAALPILPDATLGPPASVQTNQGSGPHPRQKSPHAHGVTLDPSGRFVVAADFGADRVFVYPYDRATHQLSASTAPAEALPAGSGPRHLAFHPNGRFLFVVSELVPELRVYRWNARHGRLNLLQTLAAPADPKAGLAKGAEVIVSRDGRFVYISLRGEDTLVAYSVNRRTGVLREVQRIAAGGQSPWSIGIDLSGRWMLVANQASNTIAAFSRDPASGRLAPTGETLAVSKPVSVAYLKGPSCR